MLGDPRANLREDLRVDIPEEFKYTLMDRFTPSPSEKRVARIDIPCPLCEAYGENCEGCPFHQFELESIPVAGCQVWTEAVIGSHNFECSALWVCWEASQGDTVSEQLRLLRKRAEELIAWT